MPRTLALLTLVVAACNWQEPMAPPNDLAPDAPDGVYRGGLELEVRAFVGPLRVKRETCSQPFELTVDTESGVSGRVVCDLGSAGILEVMLLGDINSMPWVGGDLETPEFSGAWEGWFYDEDRAYGETIGEAETDQGIRVEWFGFFDARHVSQDLEALEGTIEL